MPAHAPLLPKLVSERPPCITNFRGGALGPVFMNRGAGADALNVRLTPVSGVKADIAGNHLRAMSRLATQKWLYRT